MSYRSLVLSFSLMSLAACASNNPADAPAEVLNSPAFLKVGDRVISAPISEIAYVTGPSDCNCVTYFPMDDDDGSKDAKRLASDASGRLKPVRAGHIEIYPGNTYERSDVDSDCAEALLSWSCRAKRLGIVSDLPDHLTISDTKFLRQFKSHHTVGAESLYDYLSVMAPLGAVLRSNVTNQESSVW